MRRRKRPLKPALHPLPHRHMRTHAPATIFSFHSEPNNPCAFCVCAPRGEETALCPIGLSTADLNVFNKTDTVDIRSTRCHGRCGGESQLWVGELFTSPLYSSSPPITEQLKGSSVHLKQKKKNHNNSTQPHRLLSRLKPYSVHDSRARSPTRRGQPSQAREAKLVMESVGAR